MPSNIDLAEEYLNGRVEISGAWNGLVLLHGSWHLANSAARVIFGTGRSEVTAQHRSDAIYELTNVIAGNMKLLLPGPCQLALPQVLVTTLKSSDVAYAECVSEWVFDCQGQP